VIVFVNRFTVHGPPDEFERAFAETAAFFAGCPGFISHRLVRSTGDPRLYVNIAEWTDQGALRAATERPPFQEHAGRLRALASSDPQFFETVAERRP
jgi:heme-degrading monooxygenase HmoA